VIKAVVFDVGECLVDETREYRTWADWLDVPRHTPPVHPSGTPLRYTTAPTSGPRTSSCDHHSEVTSLAYSTMRAR